MATLAPAIFTATTATSFVEFQRTLAGTAILTNIAITAVPHGTWTEEGTGTMSVNSASSVDLVASGATPKSARRSFATEAGKSYDLSFTLSSQAAQVSVGSTPTTVNLRAAASAPIGANTVTFTATSTIAHVKFATSVAGSLFVGGVALTEATDPAVDWLPGGPGAVTNESPTTVTIAFARERFSAHEDVTAGSDAEPGPD